MTKLISPAPVLVLAGTLLPLPFIDPPLLIGLPLPVLFETLLYNLTLLFLPALVFDLLRPLILSRYFDLALLCLLLPPLFSLLLLYLSPLLRRNP